MALDLYSDSESGLYKFGRLLRSYSCINLEDGVLRSETVDFFLTPVFWTNYVKFYRFFTTFLTILSDVLTLHHKSVDFLILWLVFLFQKENRIGKSLITVQNIFLKKKCRFPVFSVFFKLFTISKQIFRKKVNITLHKKTHQEKDLLLSYLFLFKWGW